MKKYFIILAALIVAVGLWIILPPLLHEDKEEEVSPPPPPAVAAQELVDKKVSVVLGSHGSTFSLVGGEFFTKAQIPAIAITATNPLVTSSSDYYFRACFVESFQGVALAKYVVEQMGTSTAAIFRDAEDDYAAAVSQTFSDKMVQLTADENAVVKVIEYTSAQEDFKTQRSDHFLPILFNKIQIICSHGIHLRYSD